MEIIQDFIPKGRRNRPGYLLIPTTFTEHETGNTSKGAGALAHARYSKGDHAASRPASWNYTADDKYLIQHLPVNENGWHAGDGGRGPGNRTSLSGELCINVDSDFEKAQYNMAWLIAYLMRTGVLPPGTVLALMRQHWDWSGKNCPAILRRTGKWPDFLKYIEKHLAKSVEELNDTKEVENEDDQPLEDEELDQIKEVEMPPDFLPPDIDRSQAGGEPADWQNPNQVPKLHRSKISQYRPTFRSRFEGLIVKPPTPKKIRPMSLITRVNI